MEHTTNKKLVCCARTTPKHISMFRTTQLAGLRVCMFARVYKRERDLHILSGVWTSPTARFNTMSMSMSMLSLTSLQLPHHHHLHNTTIHTHNRYDLPNISLPRMSISSNSYPIARYYYHDFFLSFILLSFWSSICFIL